MLLCCVVSCVVVCVCGVVCSVWHAENTVTCRNTCARGAGTHGDVLNVHTGTF